MNVRSFPPCLLCGEPTSSAVLCRECQAREPTLEQATLFGYECRICGEHHLRRPAGQPVTGRPIPPGEAA